MADDLSQKNFIYFKMPFRYKLTDLLRPTTLIRPSLWFFGVKKICKDIFYPLNVFILRLSVPCRKNVNCRVFRPL